MDSDNSTTIIEYDIRGQICPSCLLFALREINKVQHELKKQRLKIVIMTDNRNAISTIPEAMASMGYGTTVDKKEGYYQIEISALKKTER